MKDELKIKIIKKGEIASMPLNHAGHQWVNFKAEQNGIILTIGPTNSFGVFLNEEKLKEIIEKFEKETKDETSNTDHDVDVRDAVSCRR